MKILKIEQSIYPYNPELSGLPFLLTGIGGSRYQSRISRPDGYRWHQILYCADGEGVLEYDGKTEELHKGTFVFLPKAKAHGYYPTTKQWEVNWIAFDGKGCDDTLAAFGMTGIIAAETDDTAYMEDIFGKMLTSQKTDILYSGYTCSGLVYDYIIGFRRLFATDADNKKSRQMSLLLPALKYMYDNYAEDIPMTYLAQLTGVTHQHFCRLFRSTMNMRPGDYLTHRRIDEAKRLLSENKLSVAEIAEVSGFRDPCYFSTTFKKYVGVSPAAFRKDK
ncbi:MAG TPA: hypothetical protein DDX72_09975 [Ruminococcaceae bacterium]|nr:hypothetical protein [Oscillospiraceae bacterium]